MLLEEPQEIQMGPVSHYLKSNSIHLATRIASGHYGEVWFGFFNGNTKVACKCATSDNKSSEEHKQLIKEISMLKTLSHPNIIQYIGLYEYFRGIGLQDFLIMEYAENGSSKAYLQKHTDTGCGTLLAICTQICNAMIYLTEQNIIHRDISARNVVLKSDLTAKLCDFGRARKLSPYETRFVDPSNASIPVLWSSPETIKEKVYNSMTDVWSYGVFVWEIFMYGKDPWTEYGEVGHVMNAIINGTVLALGEEVSLEIRYMLESIFSFNPLVRPTFVEIGNVLYRTREKYFGTQPQEEFYGMTEIPSKPIYNNHDLLLEIPLLDE
jgi:serine/threonine protein kinase